MKNKLLMLAFAGMPLLATSNIADIGIAEAATVKDAAYCRAAGAWAVAEVTRRIENKDRRILDAVEDFGPVQLEDRSYYTFILESIYKEEIQEFPEWMEDLSESMNGLLKDFAKNLAEDICVKEFLS